MMDSNGPVFQHCAEKSLEKMPGAPIFKLSSEKASKKIKNPLKNKDILASLEHFQVLAV
jgi:hypothetical protein